MSQPDLRNDFAVMMGTLGPFEPSPHLAVAVSGGSDSLALLLLLRDWLMPLRGRLTALTVDHGLRPEAAAECRQVAEMIAGLNRREPEAIQVDHEILAWMGGKPASGIMAAARAARYRLLADWCRHHHVLHLALGHHADDQGETLLMRQHHGSGSTGLAGMSGIRVFDGVRLLRPLLACRKDVLRAVVRSAALAWIEDPSNSADRFERVQWRRRLSQRGEIGPLLAEGRQAGRQRDLLDRRLGAWLSIHGRCDPAGYITLALAPLLSLGMETASRLLAQLLPSIGGADFPPAPAALARLLERLNGAPEVTTTLGGCVLLRRGERLMLFREAADCGETIPLSPGQTVIWDRRWMVALSAYTYTGLRRIDATFCVPPTLPLRVGAVGTHGLANRPLSARLAAVLPLARPALPALWHDDNLLTVGVPVAGGEMPDVECLAIGPELYKLDVSFQPYRPATSCGFAVV